jgi:hypothetical protein
VGLERARKRIRWVLTAYLKKKGENLATHEDIALLVEQVRAVTTATKEIEAKISTEVWDRQKRWEMKRDLLFEATRRLAAADESLMNFNSACEIERRHKQRGEAVSLETKLKASDKWVDASNKFEETSLLVGIVCGKEVTEACFNHRFFTRQIADKLYSNDAEIYFKSIKELVAKSGAVTAAIRKELETGKNT